MTAPASAPPAEPGELAFPLESGADLYALHRALEARFGPRREAGWLWALLRRPDGDLCVVRRPAGFAAPPLAAGQRWLFGLHARVGQKDGATGRRGSWRRAAAAQRLSWLERRGAEHGFAVVRAAVEVAREEVRKPGAAFWLDRSEFSGIARIVDPGKAALALASGVGGGRAWGLGMLRLIREWKE